MYQAKITQEQVLDDVPGHTGRTTRAQHRRAAQPQAATSPSGRAFNDTLSTLTPESEDDAVRNDTSSAGFAAEGGSANSRTHDAAEDREEHSPVRNTRNDVENRLPAMTVDTIDSEGFVVPKKTAKKETKTGKASPISSMGTIFNEMFYEPADKSDADDEESISDESERTETSRSTTPSWAEMAEDPETDPFGPIPEEWSKDPFANIPLDWMSPEATSTPVKVVNDTIFDELHEIALASMTPRARKLWRRRNAKIRDVKPVSEYDSETTQTSGTSRPRREASEPPLQLAAMRMGAESSDDDYPPRYTTEQKGKGKATEPVASSSRYKATVEEVTDDEDPRKAQIKSDEHLARQLFEQELEDTEASPRKIGQCTPDFHSETPTLRSEAQHGIGRRKHPHFHSETFFVQAETPDFHSETPDFHSETQNFPLLKHTCYPSETRSLPF